MISGEEARLVREMVGQRLISARLRANLSQRGGAEMAGIAQAALSNYEVGRRDIPLITLLLLCRCYAVAPEDVIWALPEPVHERVKR